MMHFDGSVVVASHGTRLVKLVPLTRRAPGSVAPELLPTALAWLIKEAYRVIGVDGGNENPGSGYCVRVHVLTSLRLKGDTGGGKVTFAVKLFPENREVVDSFVRSAWLAPSAP